MFTNNRKHLEEFCNKILEKQLPFEWGCSSRIDVLDEKTVSLMKKANCTDIFLGIETGSDKIQKIINKNLDLSKAVEMIKYINKVKIKPTLSFVYCFPDETVDDFYETIKIIEEILKNGIYNVALIKFIPLPETIEAKNIAEIMYYDRSVLNTTMTGVIPNKNLEDMIKNNPDIFSYYYTFKSEVREKFMRFDILLTLKKGGGL